MEFPMDEETKYSEKNYNVVALCYVLGLFGVHQFYLGNKKAGFLRLGLFPTIFPPLLILIALYFPCILYIGKMFLPYY